MPRVANGPTTQLADGRILIAGGGPVGLADAEIYDPATTSWIVAPSLPEGYHGPTASLLGDGRVLLAGGDAPSGSGARGYPHAVIFDPTTNRWLAAPNMLHGRLAHAAVRIQDGRVLLVGGAGVGAPETDADVFPDAELYDPMRNAWTFAPPMLERRAPGAAVLLTNGRVLVIGGSIGLVDGTATTELFDPLASR